MICVVIKRPLDTYYVISLLVDYSGIGTYTQHYVNLFEFKSSVHFIIVV